MHFVATSWLKGLPTLWSQCWDVLFYLDIYDDCGHPGVIGLWFLIVPFLAGVRMLA